MIDNEIRQAMAGLLDEEPIHGVEVDRALDAGRSAVRVRRIKVVVSCALAAVVVAVAVPLASTTLVKGADGAPADTPTPSIVEGDVPGGWIVYQRGGYDSGIWAVDPGRPDDPEHQIQLTTKPKVLPLEWSSDGTKLLVQSWGPDGQGSLSVLHADGTETLIADGRYYLDGSFSPDGSRVIYTPYGNGGLAIVDSEGGTPRRLLGPDSAGVYAPAFSPDGKQIAYFTGGGDNSHTLRVMNLDGTGGRTLFFRDCACHIDDLDWSPDGQRLMFSFQLGEGGIWIVGVDGSNPTQVVPNGVNPAWSPDGTRISYQYGVGSLRIADADGSHVTEFDYGGSGAWKPLPLDQ